MRNGERFDPIASEAPGVLFVEELAAAAVGISLQGDGRSFRCGSRYGATRM
jgi:hypothetical protein